MKKIKIIAICLLIASLFTVLSGCGGEKEEGTIKIGLIYEQTGPSASLGERHFEGATLAVKMINDAGGINGKKIELLAEDDLSTNPGAVNAFERLVEKKLHAIIAPGFSTMLQAMAPRVKQEGIPTLMGGSLVALTTQDNPGWFRVRAADTVTAVVMIDFITKNLKTDKIAILHDSEAFGQGGTNNVIAYMKTLNLEPVCVDKYTAGSKDYTPQLLKAKDAGAKALIVFSPNSQDSAVIVRQVRELNLDFEIMGSASFSTQVTLEIAGKATEGMYSVQEFNADASDESRKFRDAYFEAYKKEPDHFGAWTYDSVNIIANAISASGSIKKDDIINAIKNTKGLKGALGSFTPNEIGDMMHKMNVITVKDGKFEVVE